MRLLAIPYETKLAAASPFHCCFVSPGSKGALLARPPNHVDKVSFTHLHGGFRDGHHTSLSIDIGPRLPGSGPGIRGLTNWIEHQKIEASARKLHA